MLLNIRRQVHSISYTSNCNNQKIKCANNKAHECIYDHNECILIRRQVYLISYTSNCNNPQKKTRANNNAL